MNNRQYQDLVTKGITVLGGVMLSICVAAALMSNAQAHDPLPIHLAAEAQVVEAVVETLAEAPAEVVEVVEAMAEAIAEGVEVVIEVVEAPASASQVFPDVVEDVHIPSETPVVEVLTPEDIFALLNPDHPCRVSVYDNDTWAFKALMMAAEHNLCHIDHKTVRGN